METIIYFVRHGQIKKPQKVIPGELPFNLNNKGKKQIWKAANYLSKRKKGKIVAIYTSPIKRAYESTKIIHKKFPKIKTFKSDLLKEWRTKWAGQPEKEVRESKEWLIFLTKPTRLSIGEKITALALRMERICRDIIKKYRGNEIICVSHQDPIRALRLKLEDKSLDLLTKIPCDRGSITTFYFNGNHLTKVKYMEPK